MLIKRAIHRGLSRVSANCPVLSKKLVAAFSPIDSKSIPWCPVYKPLEQSKIALVTTAGVHHKDQQPFDMNDDMGDPTFRILDDQTIADGYKITHDYYDHRDAERDLNIVFPVQRLKDMQAADLIRSVSEMHFSFMGHIDGHHVDALINRSAPEVARMLKDLEVDVVLLTPA